MEVQEWHAKNWKKGLADWLVFARKAAFNNLKDLIPAPSSADYLWLLIQFCLRIQLHKWRARWFWEEHQSCGQHPHHETSPWTRRAAESADESCWQHCCDKSSPWTGPGISKYVERKGFCWLKGCNVKHPHSCHRVFITRELAVSWCHWAVRARFGSQLVPLDQGQKGKGRWPDTKGGWNELDLQQGISGHEIFSRNMTYTSKKLRSSECGPVWPVFCELQQLAEINDQCVSISMCQVSNFSAKANNM